MWLQATGVSKNIMVMYMPFFFSFLQLYSPVVSIHKKVSYKISYFTTNPLDEGILIIAT